MNGEFFWNKAKHYRHTYLESVDFELCCKSVTCKHVSCVFNGYLNFLFFFEGEGSKAYNIDIPMLKSFFNISGELQNI